MPQKGSRMVRDVVFSLPKSSKVSFDWPIRFLWSTLFSLSATGTFVERSAEILDSSDFTVSSEKYGPAKCSASVISPRARFSII